jgi:hypothetical protein
VDSVPREGTTTQLIFPVCEVREEILAEEPAAPGPYVGIPCVDDEPLLREAPKETLVGQGH